MGGVEPEEAGEDARREGEALPLAEGPGEDPTDALEGRAQGAPEALLLSPKGPIHRRKGATPHRGWLLSQYYPDNRV